MKGKVNISKIYHVKNIGGIALWVTIAPGFAGEIVKLSYDPTDIFRIIANK